MSKAKDLAKQIEQKFEKTSVFKNKKDSQNFLKGLLLDVTEEEKKELLEELIQRRPKYKQELLVNLSNIDVLIRPIKCKTEEEIKKVLEEERKEREKENEERKEKDKLIKAENSLRQYSLDLSNLPEDNLTEIEKKNKSDLLSQTNELLGKPDHTKDQLDVQAKRIHDFLRAIKREIDKRIKENEEIEKNRKLDEANKRLKQIEEETKKLTEKLKESESEEPIIEKKEEPIIIPKPVVEEKKEEPIIIPKPVVEEKKEEPIIIPKPVLEEKKEEPIIIPKPVVEEKKEEPIIIPKPVVEEEKEEPIIIPKPVVEEKKEEPIVKPEKKPEEDNEQHEPLTFLNMSLEEFLKLPFVSFDQICRVISIHRPDLNDELYEHPEKKTKKTKRWINPKEWYTRYDRKDKDNLAVRRKKDNPFKQTLKKIFSSNKNKKLKELEVSKNKLGEEQNKLKNILNESEEKLPSDLLNIEKETALYILPDTYTVNYFQEYQKNNEWERKASVKTTDTSSNKDDYYSYSPSILSIKLEEDNLTNIFWLNVKKGDAICDWRWNYLWIIKWFYRNLEKEDIVLYENDWKINDGSITSIAKPIIEDNLINEKWDKIVLWEKIYHQNSWEYLWIVDSFINTWFNRQVVYLDEKNEKHYQSINFVKLEENDLSKGTQNTIDTLKYIIEKNPWALSTFSQKKDGKEVEINWNDIENIKSLAQTYHQKKSDGNDSNFVETIENILKTKEMIEKYWIPYAPDEYKNRVNKNLYEFTDERSFTFKIWDEVTYITHDKKREYAGKLTWFDWSKEGGTCFIFTEKKNAEEDKRPTNITCFEHATPEEIEKWINKKTID